MIWSTKGWFLETRRSNLQGITKCFILRLQPEISKIFKEHLFGQQTIFWTKFRADSLTWMTKASQSKSVGIKISPIKVMAGNAGNVNVDYISFRFKQISDWKCLINCAFKLICFLRNKLYYWYSICKHN